MSVSEPLVCAIMLTRDRPVMARRAVEAFRAQKYGSKRLLIYDTGREQISFGCDRHDSETHFRCFYNAHRGLLTIGALRNEANSHSDDGPYDPAILIHWDDDDYSDPNRIAEQVALLQASGADAVGYRETLFWRTGGSRLMVGDAWLYSHPRPDYALGTSLCYWRKTWRGKPFADLPKGPGATGEDHQWQQGLKVASVSAMGPLGGKVIQQPAITDAPEYGPRMIASIHQGNSSQAYDLEALLAKRSKEWRRTPEWDDFCRIRMALY